MTLQVVMMIVVFQGRAGLKLLALELVGLYNAHISAASKKDAIIYIAKRFWPRHVLVLNCDPTRGLEAKSQ